MSKKLNKYGKSIVSGINIPNKITKKAGDFAAVGVIKGETPGQDLVLFIKTPPNN